MANELYFHTRDLYPNKGYMTTALETVPEAEDQVSMVDSQAAAEQLQIQQNPVDSKAILIFVGVIIGIIVLFSL